MTTKADIQEFIGLDTIALVGVSRSGTKFSNATFNELRGKGYTVYAVNHGGGEYNGQVIYPSLDALPGPVDGTLVMVRPDNAAGVARECARLGIRNIWFQRGAESSEALQVCRENSIRAVSGECILMYAGKSGFHKIHRFFRELFGGMPK
jgi:predicted CoA-binding protein